MYKHLNEATATRHLLLLHATGPARVAAAVLLLLLLLFMPQAKSKAVFAAPARYRKGSSGAAAGGGGGAAAAAACAAAGRHPRAAAQFVEGCCCYQQHAFRFVCLGLSNRYEGAPQRAPKQMVASPAPPVQQLLMLPPHLRLSVNPRRSPYCRQTDMRASAEASDAPPKMGCTYT